MLCCILMVGGPDRDELIALAGSRGWMVTDTVEVPRSEVARGLRQFWQLAQQGSFRAVVVDTVLLPGLGAMPLLRELAQMTELGIEVASAREPWLSTSGDQGQLLSWIACRIDEERRDGVRASLARARLEGRRLGRPRAAVPTETVLALREAGASLRYIGRVVGLGTATIQRFLAANAAAGKARGR